MRVVIQRVSKTQLYINKELHSSIQQGLLVLLGIEENDNNEDIEWLSHKISQLRIFSDQEGKMNLSVNDILGEIMVVSQFTLHAQYAKGNRPSFVQAAKPDIAIPLYEQFIITLQTKVNKTIATGKFGADMQIELCNDGPVTILMDSKTKQ